MDMHAKLRRLQAGARALGLVIVDYLQLMTGRGRFENRNQEVSALSRGMKLLAKELNVPMLVLSQLSRAAETRQGDHRPQLSDLRESGSIEQDADVVGFIFREEVYTARPRRPARPGRADRRQAAQRPHRHREPGLPARADQVREPRRGHRRAAGGVAGRGISLQACHWSFYIFSRHFPVFPCWQAEPPAPPRSADPVGQALPPCQSERSSIRAKPERPSFARNDKAGLANPTRYNEDDVPLTCYLDAFSGISGDMLVGALADAGADPEAIVDAIASLETGAAVSFEKVKRGGIAATKYHVEVERTACPPAPVAHRQDDREGGACRRAPSAMPWPCSGGWAKPKRRSTRCPSKRCTSTKWARPIRSPISWARALAFDLLGVDTIVCSPLNVGSGTVETRARHAAGARARHRAAAGGRAGLLARPGGGADHAHRRRRGRHAGRTRSARCRP